MAGQLSDAQTERGPGPDGERSLAVVREMYALALELMTSQEQYYASHGRRLGARLHHMILSQDPAGELGFFDDTYR